NSWGSDWLAQAARDGLGCRPLSLHVYLLQRDPNPRKERQCRARRVKRTQPGGPLRRGGRGGERGTQASRQKTPGAVPRKLPDSIETRMRELFDARLNLDDKPMTAAELAETVKNADVLVPTVTDRIDSSVLSKAGDKLKLIANYGNGVDHIDVATALSRGITVT